MITGSNWVEIIPCSSCNKNFSAPSVRFFLTHRIILSWICKLIYYICLLHFRLWMLLEITWQNASYFDHGVINGIILGWLLRFVHRLIKTNPAWETFLSVRNTWIVLSSLKLLNFAAWQSWLATIDNHQRWSIVLKCYGTLINAVSTTNAKFLESFIDCSIQGIITCCIFDRSSCQFLAQFERLSFQTLLWIPYQMLPLSWNSTLAPCTHLIMAHIERSIFHWLCLLV